MSGKPGARREEMLREMGIGPVWKLRTSEQVPEPEQPAVSVEPVAGEAAAPAASHPPSPTGSGHEPASIAKMDWPALQDSVASCVACGLYAKRNKTVFGVGDRNADWLFVGEGPGAEEDAQGEPFVGQAGALLDNMLAAIELKRGANVYIANIVKCRPPQNRDPEQDEVAECEPFLKQQIAVIQPEVIVALGRCAAQTLLRDATSITRMRGKWREYQGIPLMPTFHPAYLLRNAAGKKSVWIDLQQVMGRLGLQVPKRTS